MVLKGNAKFKLSVELLQIKYKLFWKYFYFILNAKFPNTKVLNFKFMEGK